MNHRRNSRAFAAFGPLLALSVAFCPLGLGAAEPEGEGAASSSPQTPDKPTPDKPASDKPASDGKTADPLAPLPADRLPPRTSEPPDPAKRQYVRDPVFVRIGEVIVNSKGEEILPDVQVVDIYLQEYLRRAGFTIATSPEAARYRIEGDVLSEYYKDLKVQGKTVAYKVRAECSFFVLDREGRELESFAIPEVYRESVKSEESAFLDLRRYVAKLEWDHLRTSGEAFGDPEVSRSLDALCAAATAGAESDDSVTMTTEAVITRLAARGLAVVPFMLEALTDTRPVLMRSHYPGLDEKNRSELKVYHIADKVLEEIFQKVSRLSLVTPERGRFRIMMGWEQEWRRFCPPYRDSPNAPAAKAK